MSIVTAPWRLKTWVMVENIRSRITISLPSPASVSYGRQKGLSLQYLQSFVPLGVFNWNWTFSFPMSALTSDERASKLRKRQDILRQILLVGNL